MSDEPVFESEPQLAPAESGTIEGSFGMKHSSGDSLHTPPGTQQRRRRPRRAFYVSEADRHLLELGLPPSWEQQVSDADRDLFSCRGTGSAMQEGSSSNDQRLLEAVPPHSHTKM